MSIIEALQNMRVQLGLLILLIAIGIFGIDAAAEIYASTHTKSFMADLPPSQGILNTQLELSLLKGQPLLASRLEEQHKQVLARMKHHLNVMALFYRSYYCAISTSSFLAAVAALLLFVITKTGWTQADSRLTWAFLLLATASVLYRSYPAVYEQEKNIAANKSLYRSFVSLANEMHSYGATLENLQGDATEPAKFIHYVDQEVARLSDIAIGFDSKVQPDYTKALNGK